MNQGEMQKNWNDYLAAHLHRLSLLDSPHCILC
ncbi:hypothetical protein ANN_19753, partial [Periplaneta americana]